jgi:hypothetical protein
MKKIKKILKKPKKAPNFCIGGLEPTEGFTLEPRFLTE